MRNFRQLDQEQVQQDVSSKCEQLLQSKKHHVADLAQAYYNTLRETLDIHAPAKTVTLRRANPSPWYNEDVDEARHKRHQMQHIWRRTELEIHRQLYTEALNAVTASITKAKIEYFQEKLESADSKSMFRSIKSLSGQQNDIFPEFDNPQNGCEKFSDFFMAKVQKIRTELDSSKSDILPDEVACFSRPFPSFRPTSAEEILQIMTHMKKTCDPDPLPARQHKQCLQAIVPAGTLIVNKSLAGGTVPNSLREAHVRPLIKKPSLDQDVLKNYRPVSNIPLLSKVIEKVVVRRLGEYLDSQDIQERFKSAYRKNHSTETALVRVTDDIKLSLDNKKGTLLVLLDLSAAFDTIYHRILLSRLRRRFGVQRTTSKWI